MSEPLKRLGVLLTLPVRDDASWAKVQHWATIVLAMAACSVTATIVLGTVPNIGASVHGAPMFRGFQLLNDSVLALHIATAIPPLLLGFYAFSRGSRQGGARWHRIVGTTYCVTIWISAVTGLMLAIANPNGLWAKLGFGTLAVVWFTTTTFAYLTARRKEYAAHRVWMIRSFAVTLAVVSIRPMGLFGPLLPGFSAQEWYVVLTWMCWVPNLIVGELYARITTPAGRLKVWRTSRAEAPGTLPTAA